MAEVKMDGCVLIMGQGIWGRGGSIKAAKKQFKKEGGRPKSGYIIVYCTDPKAYVDGLGRVTYNMREDGVGFTELLQEVKRRD